ncbi:MAG TPA: flagellar protein FlaG [Terriglobales bacterium]|nr:flagellar protein FlaG [Terriglobales bacterium]
MIIAPVPLLNPIGQADGRAVISPAETRNSSPQVQAPAPVQASTTSLPLLEHREQEVKRIFDGKRMVYRFVDKQSGEVIYQVPSDEVLNIMRAIQEQLQRQQACNGIDRDL